jgi:hypothetical protein
MRKRISNYHIDLMVFLITVFLISPDLTLSASASPAVKTGEVRCNSVSACRCCDSMAIRSDASRSKIIYVSGTSLYPAITSAVFPAIYSLNRPNLTSLSMGSYLNGIFKKLKRFLSGLSKFL